MNDVRTAVYGADEKTIIVGKELSLQFLDLDFNVLNEITLSLPGLDPDNIEIDKYRTMWLNEPTDKGFSMFVAYFESEK
jgi:hypothetical protein